MNPRLFFFLFILFVAFSCKKNEANHQDSQQESIPFDSEKWSTMEGNDFPLRNLMVDDILYTDKIRKLKKGAILNVLGSPDREQDGHLYYKVS